MMMKFDSSADPIQNFMSLYQQAEELQIKTANAFQLATVDKFGFPNNRTVLFKGLIQDQISFYTNYNSPKATELMLNSKACALFFWTQMDVQVRILGDCKKTSIQDSQKYFATRPRDSQIGAWASDQSKLIQNYSVLEKRFQEFEKKFLNQNVPCPDHWGGFVLKAEKIEFWFGKKGRLHERYLYQTKNNSWELSLLNP